MKFRRRAPTMMKIPVKDLQNIGYEFHTYQKTSNGNLVTFVFPSEGVPSTPQHSDSHPCTRPRWSRSLSWWSRSLSRFPPLDPIVLFTKTLLGNSLALPKLPIANENDAKQAQDLCKTICRRGTSSYDEDKLTLPLKKSPNVTTHQKLATNSSGTYRQSRG